MRANDVQYAFESDIGSEEKVGAIVPVILRLGESQAQTPSAHKAGSLVITLLLYNRQKMIDGVKQTEMVGHLPVYPIDHWPGI